MNQQRLRKAIGVLKDSTTVGLARLNSNYKELHIAIVKATNHAETLPKEKYISTIFDAVSASSPRADVAFCINLLIRRLTRTHNWAVAVKSLIVIHRALREVPTFQEEFLNYMDIKSYMLNQSHLKDGSSPNACNYSSWVRIYALYLGERLECFRVLKYDVETGRTRTSELDTVGLLEHLPALQQLLYRLLTCQPEGAAVYNSMIQYALSLVVSESIKIYNAINGCIQNLVDKFFEMDIQEALRALVHYRKAMHQAARLSGFYETCKGLGLWKEQKFVKVEQPPASFIETMEEYTKITPHTQPHNQNVVDVDRRLPASKPIKAIEHKKASFGVEKPETIPSLSVPSECSEVETCKALVPEQTQITDLLGLDDFGEGTAKLEEDNALALAIVTNYDPPESTSTVDLTSETSGWELALLSAARSNESATANRELAGSLDKLTLDRLYDEANSSRAYPTRSDHLSQVAPNPFEVSQFSQDPFYAYNNVATTAEQQQQAMVHDSTNPFGNPFLL